MVRYETLLLARTEITEDELNFLEETFERYAKQGDGEMVSFDKWGKYRLAYPVEKNAYGIYLLVRYNLQPEHITAVQKDLTTFLKIKCNNFVMRSMTARLDENAPLTYQKPESVEGARAEGSRSDELKEGKIESLLDSVDSGSARAKKEETVKKADVIADDIAVAADAGKVAVTETVVEEAASPDADAASDADDSSDVGQA